MGDDLNLSRSVVERVIKNKLEALGEEKIGMEKDAKTALTNAAKIFILYLTSTANDITGSKKRSTISHDDIMAAVKEIGFDQWEGSAQDFIDGFLKKEEEKKANRPPPKKKQKKEDADENGNDGAAEGEGGQDKNKEDENGDGENGDKMDEGEATAAPGGDDAA